jgi:hypothetical protein
MPRGDFKITDFEIGSLYVIITYFTGKKDLFLLLMKGRNRCFSSCKNSFPAGENGPEN